MSPDTYENNEGRADGDAAVEDQGGTMKQLRRLEWTKELSRSFWGDLAGSDFGESTAFSRFASPYLVELVRPHLPPEGVLLDYGGGDNLYLVRELLRGGFRLACFEPNSNVESRNRDLKNNVRFLGAVSDVEADHYDAIFFSEVIEHLPDHEAGAVLQKLHFGLKETGTLIVTTPDNEDLFCGSRYCPTCRTLFHPWGHVRSFTAETLEAILKRNGFVCEELHSVDFSATREPIEQAKRKATELAAVSERLMRLADAVGSRLSTVEAEVLKEAARTISSGLPAAGQDSKRRHIGFGGTLVAVARKRQAEPCAA